MTWTKLSDDFGDQCIDLSDAAFRTHVEGLLWTMRRETGGLITTRDVTRFAETQDPALAVRELVDCGWWSIESSRYRINHHMEHQPEPDVVAARRSLAAERQRRKRRRDARIDDTSRRDNPRDNPRDPGLVGTDSGRVWSGNEERNEEPTSTEWAAHMEAQS